MRIAIVGAGVSGLVCAHMLHRDHELVVFEAGDRAGGHANTVHVETDTGAYDLDTGFIVFNDRNYPGFERLLGELGVATQPSQMSFGVSDGVDFEYNGSSPNGLFATRRNLLTPSFHRMIADLVRFNRDARRLLASRRGSPRCGDWLAQRRYSTHVRRAADRPAGIGRVVGRPGADVVFPGALPDRVLRQPRHARIPRPAALADDRRRLAALRRGAHAALARASAALARR